MTVTLTCYFCGRREPRTEPWSFPEWYKVMAQDGALQGNDVCSLECMASWAMRTQLERERAEVTP